MLDLYRYRLPFKHPFITGASTFQHREGLLLRYYNSNVDVLSDVAPLPGFSRESLKQAEEFLLSIKEETALFFDRQFTADELNSWLQSRSAYPSCDFGLSSLGLSILSIRQQVPLHSLLHLPSAPSLQVNAVLGKTDEATFMSRAENYINNGFDVLKCKVTAEPGHLPRSLKSLAENYPNVSFRLDANRSWEFDHISELSSQFSNLPVEYIEDPSPADSIEQFQSIIEACTLPVAADETLSEFGLQTVVDHIQKEPYLVIKPTLIGNIMEIFATIGSRHHLEDRVIYTTALESAVGARMIASAAAMTGSNTTAHGLNTGSLFRQNLADEDAIINGTFRFKSNFKSWYTFQQINQTLLTPVL
jgi:O-succinylbenzoate synthase